MNISVCIATYNGEKFIEAQLESILHQLDSDDEVIIVDDCSQDRTVDIINGYNDKRIKLYLNKINKKHVCTFEKAIKHAKKDLIFLSDQDDIWVKDRVKLIKSYFTSTNCLLISSNFSLFDKYQKSMLSRNPLKSKDSQKYLNNIFGILFGKRDYYGCAMAFRKELLEVILPIPSYVKSHDLWIAIAANLLKSNLHIEEITVNRRIHDNNVTVTNRTLKEKIDTRLFFLFRAVLELEKRIKSYGESVN